MTKPLKKFSDVISNRKDFIEYIDRGKYRIKQSFIYWLDYDHKNEYIIVPEGFMFNFNSSPCFTHCIVDTDEFCIGIVHDYLYSRHSKIHIIDNTNLSRLCYSLMSYDKKKEYSATKRLFTSISYSIPDTIPPDWRHKSGDLEYIRYVSATRKFADKIWYYGSLEENEEILGKKNRIKCYLGYLGIRLFGWLKFKK